jgi:hypothetical protein
MNFDARKWGEIVNIMSVNCQEPPCTTKISDEDLVAMTTSPGVPPTFPIHTQSVERAVKLTSEAAKTSYVWEKRHKYIVAKSVSRNQRKAFKTKKDYH